MDSKLQQNKQKFIKWICAGCGIEFDLARSRKESAIGRKDFYHNMDCYKKYYVRNNNW